MSFNRILGQDQAKQIVQRALKKSTVAHAYLFFGPDSVGKKLTAIEIAKALNCTVSGPEDGCDQCPSCQKIAAQTHPDIFFVEPSKSSTTSREPAIRIEDIRELQRKLHFLPYEGKKKVVIIDSADLMNPQAANSFLKTLEEPPSSTVIILIVSNEYKVLPTISSRCQGVQFHLLPVGVIKQILTNRENVDSSEVNLRAAMARGQMTRALDPNLVMAGEDRQNLLKLIETVSFDQVDIIFRWAKDQAKNGDQIQTLLDELLFLLRDLALLKNRCHANLIYNLDIEKELKHLADQKSQTAFPKMFDAVHQTKSALRGNANLQLSLESMLLKFCEAA